MDTLSNWPSRSATKGEEVTVTQADGFVVVSRWRDKSCVLPPYRGSYEYEAVVADAKTRARAAIAKATA